MISNNYIVACKLTTALETRMLEAALLFLLLLGYLRFYIYATIYFITVSNLLLLCS